MKKIYSIFVISLVSILSFAQSEPKSAEDQVSIEVLRPVGIENQNTAGILQTNIMKIVSLNGLSATDSRFVIIPKIAFLSKSRTSTAPPKILVELDVSLFLGDLYSGVLMSSSSFTVKGVGENEDQAYLNAIKSLNIRDRKVKSMIVNGKKEILEYFHAEEKQILKKIEGLIAKKDYRLALIEISAIPTACEELYNKASELLAQIPTEQKNRIEITPTIIDNYYYDGSAEDRAAAIFQ